MARGQAVPRQGVIPEAGTPQPRTLAEQLPAVPKLSYKYPILTPQGQQAYDSDGNALVMESDVELSAEEQGDLLNVYLHDKGDIFSFDEVTQNFKKLGPFLKPQAGPGMVDIASPDLYTRTAALNPQPSSLLPGMGMPPLSLPMQGMDALPATGVPATPAPPTGVITEIPPVATTPEGTPTGVVGLDPATIGSFPIVKPEDVVDPYQAAMLGAAREIGPGFVAGLGVDTLMAASPIAAAGLLPKAVALGDKAYQASKIVRGASVLGKFGTAMGVGAGIGMGAHGVQEAMVPLTEKEKKAKEEHPTMYALGALAGGTLPGQGIQSPFNYVPTAGGAAARVPLRQSAAQQMGGRAIAGGVAGGMDYIQQRGEVQRGERESMDPLQTFLVASGAYAIGGNKGVTGNLADRAVQSITKKGVKVGQGSRGTVTYKDVTNLQTPTGAVVTPPQIPEGPQTSTLPGGGTITIDPTGTGTGLTVGGETAAPVTTQVPVMTAPKGKRVPVPVAERLPTTVAPYQDTRGIPNRPPTMVEGTATVETGPQVSANQAFAAAARDTNFAKVAKKAVSGTDATKELDAVRPQTRYTIQGQEFVGGEEVSFGLPGANPYNTTDTHIIRGGSGEVVVARRNAQGDVVVETYPTKDVSIVKIDSPKLIKGAADFVPERKSPLGLTHEATPEEVAGINLQAEKSVAVENALKKGLKGIDEIAADAAVTKEEATAILKSMGREDITNTGSVEFSKPAFGETETPPAPAPVATPGKAPRKARTPRTKPTTEATDTAAAVVAPPEISLPATGETTPTAPTRLQGEVQPPVGVKVTMKSGEGYVYLNPDLQKGREDFGHVTNTTGTQTPLRGRIPDYINLSDDEARNLAQPFIERAKSEKSDYHLNVATKLLDAAESVKNGGENRQANRTQLMEEWGLADARDAINAQANRGKTLAQKAADAEAKAEEARKAATKKATGQMSLDFGPGIAEYAYHVGRAAYYSTLAQGYKTADQIITYLRSRGVYGGDMERAIKQLVGRLRLGGHEVPDAEIAKLESHYDKADDLLIGDRWHDGPAPLPPGMEPYAQRAMKDERLNLLTEVPAGQEKKAFEDSIEPTDEQGFRSDTYAEQPTFVAISRSGRVYTAQQKTRTEARSVLGDSDAITMENVPSYQGGGKLVKVGLHTTPEQIATLRKMVEGRTDVLIDIARPGGAASPVRINSARVPRFVDAVAEVVRVNRGGKTEWFNGDEGDPNIGLAITELKDSYGISKELYDLVSDHRADPVKLQEAWDTIKGHVSEMSHVSQGLISREFGDIYDITSVYDLLGPQSRAIMDRLAQNPNTPTSVIREIIAGGNSPEALSENPGMPFNFFEDPNLFLTKEGQNYLSTYRELYPGLRQYENRSQLPRESPDMAVERARDFSEDLKDYPDDVRKPYEQRRKAAEESKDWDAIAFIYERKAADALNNIGAMSDTTGISATYNLSRAVYYKMMAGVIKSKPELMQYLSDKTQGNVALMRQAVQYIADLFAPIVQRIRGSVNNKSTSGQIAESVRRQSQDQIPPMLSPQGDKSNTNVSQNPELIDKLIQLQNESAKLNEKMRANLKRARAERGKQLDAVVAEGVAGGESPLLTFQKESRTLGGDYDHRLLMAGEDDILTDTDLNALLADVQFEAYRSSESMDEVGKLPRESLSQYSAYNLQHALVRLARDRVPLDNTALKIMTKVWGQDIANRLAELPSMASATERGQKFWEAMSALRAIKTSGDIGTPLRNTVFHTLKNPVEAATMLDNSRAFAFNPDKFNAYQTQMEQSKIGKLAAQAGLAIPGTIDKPTLEAVLQAGPVGSIRQGLHQFAADDRFGQSLWEQKELLGMANKQQGLDPNTNNPLYPLAQYVQISERVHVAQVTQVRYAEFERLIGQLEETGYDPYNNPEVAEKAAQAVNVMTGRAESLLGVKTSAEWMGRAFFAPKYAVASLLTKSPAAPLYAAQVARENPVIGNYVAKDMGRMAGGAVAIYTLVEGAKMAGLDVGMELDPRNAYKPEYGKLRLGDKYYEIQGATKWFKNTAQLLFGKKSIKGQDESIPGAPMMVREWLEGRPSKIGRDTYYDALGDIARTIEAPIPGYLTDVAKNQNMRGERYFGTTPRGKGLGTLAKDTALLASPIPFEQFVNGAIESGSWDATRQMLLGIIGLQETPVNRKPRQAMVPLRIQGGSSMPKGISIQR